MAFAAEESWEQEERLPAATPGVDLAGLRALALGRSRWRRQAAGEAQPPLEDEAADQDPAPPKARRLIEPLTSWC